MQDDPDARPDILQALDIEQAAVASGEATACGASCACHGAVACLRAEHPHDVGNAHPHVGRDAGGNLVQWEHTDAHGPMLTADEVAAQVAEVRRAHTRALLDSLDLDLVRELLARP